MYRMACLASFRMDVSMEPWKLNEEQFMEILCELDPGTIQKTTGSE